MHWPCSQGPFLLFFWQKYNIFIQFVGSLLLEGVQTGKHSLSSCLPSQAVIQPKLESSQSIPYRIFQDQPGDFERCLPSVDIIIPPATKLGGYIGFTLSVCSLTFRVRPVASTVQDGFFPYLVQMINSMRGCVACDDPWPWPISSRSFDLDLENRVRSVPSTVLDGFFLYLAQMITIIRGYVACYVGFTLSVCLSVCSLTFRVRPVASTVEDGFFPYLVQMINSMRGCVACDDPWPWPISSRSFGLDLENRVRSVPSTVLDGFFLYLAQMITIIRGCVACYVFFRIWKFEFLANLKKFRPWPWKKKSTVLNGFFPYLAQMITSMRGCVACNDLWPWPISSRSFGLGLENRVRSVASTVPDGFFPYLVQMITSMRRCVACDDLWPWPISSRSFDLVLTWGIQHDSIVWVIMRRRGVSSERRRSSCSSLHRNRLNLKGPQPMLTY